MKKMPKFDGPIPGENYLQDTKNFPWHRPADETDFVKIVDKAITKLSKPEAIGMMLTALESGDTILDFVTGTARNTVGNGKIPIDQAILAAGPIARHVEYLAKKAGIKYERGFEVEPQILTPEKVRAMDPVRPVPTPEVEEPAEEPMEGFMSMGADEPASAETQNTMLGGE
jgi:hypothetical protein